MKLSEIVKYIEDNLYNKYISDETSEWVYAEIININRLDIKMVSDDICTEREVRLFLEQLLRSITIEDNIKIYIGHISISSIDEAEFLGIRKPSKRQLENPTFAGLIDANTNNIQLYNEKIETTSRIISFYSYKGGVGRTIALIQTAYLLAKQGKNVLLLDLDIEAPSFYNIFKDDIKTEHGLVDYLYEDLYYDKKSISVSNIISKLNLELKGDIYVIPAGKNNISYVKKLEKLKEKRIYENKSIQNIIRETENIHNIDYTFVDSRTGINNWGALSLIDISDEVMLFAYPNRENIEGIKLILDIIKNYKNPTIVLSRIDPSKEGKKIAKKLFKELDINQEYIPVYYDSTIALAQKYPIEYATKHYEDISNFLLEGEKNKNYKDFISKNKDLVNKTLLQIGKMEKLNSIVLTNEEKVLNKNNWIIINDEENIKSIVNKINNNINIIDNNDIDLKIQDKENIIKAEDVIANMINILNKFFIYKALKIDENDIFINNKFMDFELDDFKEYIYSSNEDNKVSYFLNTVQSMFTKELTDKTMYVIDLEEVFGYVDNEYLELILGLLSLIDKDQINIKVVINKNYYNRYKKIFDENNSNILDLSWTEGMNSTDRIQEILNKSVNILDEEIIFEIEKSLFGYDDKINLDKVYSKFVSEKLLDSFEEKFNDRDKANLIEVLMKLSENQNYLNTELCQLLYGSRINHNIYSKYLVEWIYDSLIENNKLSKYNIIKLINEASKIELESNNYNKASIITKESFEKAISNLLNN